MTDTPPLLVDDDVPTLVSDEPQTDVVDKKVPVTVVTGFLGAGKTTFLSHIMTEQHGMRVAIIQNEFGEGGLGVEQASVFSDGTSEGQEWLELPNGCLCCAVRDDLVLTLEHLLTRRDKFDYVFIETSGLADPGPVASALWVDEELESALYLDAVVTVVDALHIARHIDEKKPAGVVNEAQKQVALADVILLNKTDLVSNDELKALQERLLTINSVAKVLPTNHSKVEINEVLNIRAFDLDRAMKVEEEHPHGLGGDGAASHNHKDGEGESCTDCDAHEKAVRTIAVREPLSVDRQKLTRWLGSLLWDASAGGVELAPDGGAKSHQFTEGEMDIFRLKGLVSVVDDDRKYAVQAVHSLFEVAAVEGESAEAVWGKDEERYCHLVAIGRHLNEEQLRHGLTTCTSSSSSSSS